MSQVPGPSPLPTLIGLHSLAQARGDGLLPALLALLLKAEGPGEVPDNVVVLPPIVPATSRPLVSGAPDNILPFARPSRRRSV